MVCISLTVVYLFIRLRHSYADMVQRSSRFTGAAPLCDRIPIVIMSLTYKSFRRVYLVCILFIYKEHIKQIHHLKSVLYSFDHLNREPLQAFACTWLCISLMNKTKDIVKCGKGIQVILKSLLKKPLYSRFLCIWFDWGIFIFGE